MYTGCTSIGERIQTLRRARRMSRAELSEAVGISESHMGKIEAGTRQPGILTYQKIMEVLGENMLIKNERKTVKEKCAAKAQDILLNSTDAQAVYLTEVLEYMSKNIDMVSS